MSLILLHILDFFCQLSDLLLESLNGQLVISFDLREFVDLDISFALGLPAALLSVQQLRGDNVLVRLRHFVLL